MFRVYTPETYDHHINHPIVLDDDYDPSKEEIGYEIVDMKNEGSKRLFDIESMDSH